MAHRDERKRARQLFFLIHEKQRESERMGWEQGGETGEGTEARARSLISSTLAAVTAVRVGVIDTQSNHLV